MGGNSQSGELTTAARATSVFALLMAAILSSVSALVAPSSAATTREMAVSVPATLENEFTFDLHYFAASFLAFLSTPKRVGLVYLSMIQVQQFMIRME